MNDEERAWLRSRIREQALAPAPTPAPSGVPRRALLLGALAGGAAIVTGATLGTRGEAQQISSPEERRAARDERRAALAQAGRFQEEVQAHKRDMEVRHETDEGGERSEIDILMAWSDRESVGGKTLLLFFRDAVESGLRAEGVPADIALEIADYVPGLIAKESHLDNRRAGPPVRTRLPNVAAAERLAIDGEVPSIIERYPDGSVLIEEHARGRIQALPSTFVEKGCDIAKIHDAREQARFLVAYFKDVWNIFKNMHAFNRIESRFYSRDRSGHKKFFVGPCFPDAYHAGTGTIQDLVLWFASRREKNEREEQEEWQEIGSAPYGVYRFMGSLALIIRENPTRRRELGRGRLYGNVSYNYLPELMAYADLLGNRLEQREA